jgi:ribonuclease HI
MELLLACDGSGHNKAAASLWYSKKLVAHRTTDVKGYKVTHNVAEYCGLIAGLEMILGRNKWLPNDMREFKSVDIIMDSKLVVHQIGSITGDITEERFVIRDARMMQLASKVLNLWSRIRLQGIRLKIRWVPREDKTIWFTDGMMRDGDEQ